MFRDDELEEVVLGLVLSGEVDASEAVALVGSPKAFASVRAQMVWQAVEELVGAGEPVDAVTVATRLKPRMADAASYIASLLPPAGSPANFRAYVERLLELAWRRRVNEELVKLRADLSELEPAEIVERLKELAVVPTAEKNRSFAREVAAVLRDIELGELRVYPTGHEELDFMSAGGFRPGQFIVVAGRPGHGKTAWLLHVAALAAQEARVAFYSFEMSREELILRLLAMFSGIPLHRLKMKALREEEWAELAEAADELARLKLDMPDAMPELNAFLADAYSRNAEVYVVDYLQMMHANGSALSRNEELARISRALKGLARERKAVVIAASQLNRAIESRNDKRPVLSDLRDCGSIEQDADMVMFLVRPALFGVNCEPEHTELHVAKHRSGPTGTLTARYIAPVCRFETGRMRR